MFLPLKVSAKYSSQHTQLPHLMSSSLPSSLPSGLSPLQLKSDQPNLPEWSEHAPRYSIGWARCSLLPSYKGMTEIKEMTYTVTPTLPHCTLSNSLPLPLNQVESESDLRGEEWEEDGKSWGGEQAGTFTQN